MNFSLRSQIKFARTATMSVLLWLSAAFCMGQNSVDETGISAGFGASVFTGEGVALNPGYNADFFFSHYACGKRWGFHFEGGYRGTTGLFRGLYDPTIEVLWPKTTATFHNLELGAYFKIRPHTYNRKKELAFLVGPKLSFGGLWTASGIGKNVFANSNGEVTVVNPGLHASLWIRRPLGEEQSFFIRPGAQLYVSKFYTVRNVNFSNYYLFLDFGFTFWNSH
jgi:hypothetical protein